MFKRLLGGAMNDEVIDGQVTIDGQVVEVERIDGIEVRGRRLSASGSIDHPDTVEIGDSITVELVIVGRRLRRVQKGTGPESIEITLLGQLAET